MTGAHESNGGGSDEHGSNGTDEHGSNGTDEHGSNETGSGVAVFGSVNLDRTERCSADRIARLAAAAERFPDAGETITVQDPPADFEASDVRLGGKGANQAVAAARAGADSTFHGAVGPDATDFGVRETFTAEGVTPWLFERDAPTGAAYIWVTPDGENRIVVVSGANGTLSPADAVARADSVADAAVLLLQNEIPVAAARALLDRLPDSGPTVIVDPAPAAGAAPLVTHPAVDLCTPNEREFDTLGDAVATAAANGARVVRTEGAGGASVFTDTDAEPAYHLPAPDAEVVDTTGAGDAFTGYLGAELAAGSPLRAAVEVAVRAGTRACESHGAMTAPDRASL